MFDIFVHIHKVLSFNGWHALLCIANNRHGVTIATHAIKRDYLIWMTTVGQPTKRRCSCVLTLKYTLICVYWWTRQRIHNTLIVVDRYLSLMGDKTIPDSAEPRLVSFYPPFVTGIDLPHQGVVDSYNLHNGISYTGKIIYFYWIGPQVSLLVLLAARIQESMLKAILDNNNFHIILINNNFQTWLIIDWKHIRLSENM